ncbi:MAG TPA: hypothetical protein VE641_06030, partial [Chthoniobacterales bacterium]|nr:hypothetical protein [Chthoniobacterales bacterium]
GSSHHFSPKPNIAASLRPTARRVNLLNEIRRPHHGRFFANTIELSGATPHQVPTSGSAGAHPSGPARYFAEIQYLPR